MNERRCYDPSSAEPRGTGPLQRSSAEEGVKNYLDGSIFDFSGTPGYADASAGSFIPASARRRAALSVASHVNSGSSRPK